MSFLVYGVDEFGDSAAMCRSSHERYYRWGYEVAGAKPRVMGSVRTREQAQGLAEGKALLVKATLREVGAPDAVSWWIQEELLTKTVKHCEAIVEPLSPKAASR